MDFKLDDAGRHWVTTDGGLHLWKDSNTFKAFSKNEGLPNDVVYGIEGEKDTFWVSTNKGLSRLILNSENAFKNFQNYRRDLQT